MYCGGSYLTNSNASPVVTDFNDDGLSDLLLGSQAGKIYVYINTGTPESYSFNDSCFTLSTENGTVDMGFRASIQSVDLDGDGLDDILAGYMQNELGHVSWLRNLGPEGPFRYAPPEDLYGSYGDSLITHNLEIYASVADLNGDGGLDLIVGEYWGEVYFYPGIPISGIASPPCYSRLTALENPVSGASVHLELTHTGTGILFITDLSGRIVSRHNDLSSGVLSVDMTGLPSGIYSAVLRVEQGIVRESFTLLR